MKKIVWVALVVLLLSVFGTTESRAQDYADNNDRDLIIEAYQRVFGRKALPKEIDYWKKEVGWAGSGYNNQSGKERIATYNKIIGWLKDYLIEPQGEPELIGVIKRSYMHSIGRNPKPNENLYWKKEIYAKKFSYEDLIKFQREWLKSDKGFADRTYAITQGYLNGIGRAPYPGDLEYWRDKIQKGGSNYTDVLNATAKFILEAGNEKEFIETVKRAHALAKLPAPGGSQITQIRLKIQDKPMVFGKLVEFVKNFK